MSRGPLLFAFLVAVGCAQMLFDVLGLPQAKAVAAATQVSPAMKVFTAHQRYETFAAAFHVGWRMRDGTWREHAIGPREYASMQGPYNRRNVYGAAFAYGPLLAADPRTQAMHRSVLRHAFCGPRNVRAELGVPVRARVVRVRVEPLVVPQRNDLPLQWEIDCAA